MRRSADVKTLNCPVLPRERDAVDAMKAATGLTSDGDLVRVALYRLAAHLDVATDTALFAVRSGRRARAKRKAYALKVSA